MRMVLLFFAAISLPAFAAADPATSARCDALYRLSDGDHAIEPGVVVAANGDIPTHCRVRGVIDRSIRFEVSMPVDDWSGG